MSSSTPADGTSKAGGLSNQQWVMPILLVTFVFGLLSLLAVVSFGLLGQLRDFRAEFNADMVKFPGEIRSDIGTVNSRIDALGTELRGDIGTVNSRIDALGTELRSNIATVNSRMDALGTNLRDEIVTVNGRMDNLSTELRSEIGTVNSHIDALGTKIDELKDLHLDLKDQILSVNMSVNNRMDALSTEIKALVVGAVPKVEDKTADADSQLDALSAALREDIGAAINYPMEVLSAQIQMLNDLHMGLNDQLGTINGRLDALSGAVNDHHSTVDLSDSPDTSSPSQVYPAA